MACAEFMENGLTVNNVCEMLSLPLIEQKAAKFLEENAPDVINTKGSCTI